MNIKNFGNDMTGATGYAATLVSESNDTSYYVILRDGTVLVTYRFNETDVLLTWVNSDGFVSYERTNARIEFGLK